MKKLLLTTLAVLLSLSLFGRPRELNPAVIDKHVTDWVLDQLKDMGYTILPEVIVQDTLNRKGKKIEYDDLYYQPSKDAQRIKRHKRPDAYAIVDTLVKENPDIEVNTYYNDDPFYYSNMIGRFYHGGFNYWMYSDPWYYSNWMYDPYDWYWDMRFSGYPYWNYPYYNYGFGFGWNHWNYGWHNNYWNHNNWYSHNGNWNNGGNYRRPEYGRRETASALSNHRIQPQQQRINPQDRPTYIQNRRSYQPSYNNPRMSERPLYNNSRVRSDMNTGMNNRRTEISTQTSTFNRSNTFNRSTQSHTYSTPSRSYTAPATNRSSNFSSGNTNRSSGSNFNNSSSSMGRSSGGSYSGGSSSSSSSGRSSGSSGRR